MTRTSIRGWTLALGLVLVASPALAIQIQNGSDLWQTPGDGTTFADFALQPIPADFFCAGSAPFAGKVVFQGVPLATEPAGVLGNTDTILHRLDDAAFDRDGVAVTRLQMRAMQFEGVDTFSNGCGDFRVSVVLQGEQPVTEMRIHRAGRDHGFFEAVIGVNVRMIFTPISHKAETLQLDRNLMFPPARNAWASRTGEDGVVRGGFVLVDTDADGVADTHVAATSQDFAAGWTVRGGLVERFDLQGHGAGPLRGEAAADPAEGNAVIIIEDPCQTCHCVEDHGMHCPVATHTHIE